MSPALGRAQLLQSPSQLSCWATSQLQKFTEEPEGFSGSRPSLVPRPLVSHLVFLTPAQNMWSENDFSAAPRGVSQSGEPWFRNTDVEISGAPGGIASEINSLDKQFGSQVDMIKNYVCTS